ncbi:MAG: glycoside hydrolase family protein [Verrucomicrobiales bacterium]|nr:glycoside hydrolase family protein [Verrucomicrobiales bacterium]
MRFLPNSFTAITAWLGRLPFWIIMLLSGLPVLLSPTDCAAGPMVVAYVPNWIDLKTFAGTIPFDRLTHINVAFKNPDDDDGTLSFDSRIPTLIGKARPKGVKVLISIGGGAASGDSVLKARYHALLAPEKRAGFVSVLAAYIKKHGFDGLDVDLEGPSIDENYGAFIAELAARLKPEGKLLTAALSKGYGGDKVPASVFEHLDFVNIMAYDGSGYWEPDAPGPHSSYQFAVDNVDYWLKRGLPKDKAVLGLPFYGYGFGEAFLKRDYPYNKIIAEHPGAEDLDEVGKTIFYNGRPTIRKKCRYVMENGLAGVMVWSLDSDAPGPNSLIDTIHETLLAKPKP